MPLDSSRDEESLHPLESITHAFIVKVWLEDKNAWHEGATWRGHVVHVPGNERLHITNLEQVTSFIRRYLERMGVRFGMFARVKGWIKTRLRPHTTV